MEQSNEDLQKFITSFDDDLAVLQASQSNESQLNWKGINHVVRTFRSIVYKTTWFTYLIFVVY